MAGHEVRKVEWELVIRSRRANEFGAAVGAMETLIARVDDEIAPSLADQLRELLARIVASVAVDAVPLEFEDASIRRD